MIIPRLTPEFDDAAPFNGPLDFEWEEWRTQSYFYWSKDADLEALAPLTPAACIAFSLAICEWVVRRFENINDCSQTLNYLESCWAATVDPGYGQFVPFDWRDWRGPSQAPLLIASGIASTALYERQNEPDTRWAVCYGRNLAHHVLANRGSFDAWYENSLNRLVSNHSRKLEKLKDDILANDFSLGSCVGRSVFDGSNTYVAETSNNEMLTFIERINESNPYFDRTMQGI